MPKQFWYNAQLLRLIAAISIVYIHLEAGLLTVTTDTSWLYSLRTGTDTFFVLSGFLSCYLMGRTKRSPGEFLWGRIIRITPVFWLFTLVGFVLLNALMSAENAASPTGLLLSLFFIPYEGGPVLYPTWSLTLIMEFAVIVTLAYSLSRRHGALISALMTFGLAAIGAIIGYDIYVVHIALNPMLCDFGFGALLAMLFARAHSADYQLWTQRAGLAGLGVLCAIAALWLWSGVFTDDPAATRLLWGGLAGTLFVATSLLFDLAGLSLRARWLTRLTELAFMIYLCHLFWNIVVEKAASLLPAEATIALLVLTPAAVTAIAAVAYYQVEKPLTRLMLRVPPWMALNQSGGDPAQPPAAPERSNQPVYRPSAQAIRTN